MGAITGMKPPPSNAVSAPGRISVTSPTRPMSMISVSPVASRFFGHLQLLRLDEAAILPRQSHGPAACLVDEIHDLLVHLAAQDHLDDIHGLLVGHPLSGDEGWFLSHPLHGPADLRTSAMYDNGVDADKAHEDNVLREALLQGIVGHCASAVFDNKDLSPEGLDIRHRLDEGLCFFNQFFHF